MLGDGGLETTPALVLSYPMYGHTFGVGWGWPWLFPGDEREIQPGMTLAIEAMAGRPDVGSSYFEQDVIRDRGRHRAAEHDSQGVLVGR